MKRLLFLLLVPAFLFGCPGPGGGKKDAGTGDGGEGEQTEAPLIKVTGTAELHPAAVAWAADAGVALPSLVGATARVEEPLRLALNENDATAIFSSTVLAADRAFVSNDISSESPNIVVGLGVGFIDSADAGIYRAASTIYDVTREGLPPQTNINGAVAYAMPRSFVDQLTTAIGGANVTTASDSGGSTIASAGFALIRIVNAAGAPVAGAKLSYRCSSCQKPLNGNQFWYPTGTLNAATSHANGGVTSANGLIVYINKETLAHQIFVKVDGNAAYPEHSAGAKSGVGLAVTLSPK